MTEKNKEILRRINEYAEKHLSDIDPQKTQVSVQLERLKPIMEQIASEEKMSLQDVFILYMDLQSEAAVQREQDFRKEIDGMGDLGFGPNFRFDVR